MLPNSYMQCQKKTKLILAILSRTWYTADNQYISYKVQDGTDLIECRHGLISATNLQLIPICLVIPALLIWTLYWSLVSSHCDSNLFGNTPFCRFFIGACEVKHTLRLVYIIPRAFASQDVFDFLLLHVLALKVALVDNKVVRAGEAFKAVLANIIFGGRIAWWDFGDAQHVAACWADCCCIRRSP
jgi:hypothetical protein